METVHDVIMAVKKLNWELCIISITQLKKTQS
jgi:hypothetical protein